jgi:hypothetical protein
MTDSHQGPRPAAKEHQMSKLLPCQACCPRTPGYPIGRVRHERAFVEINGVHVWALQCDNCGNIKKPRQATKRRDYDWVTVEAPSDSKMSLVNSVRFHCFNPNGLYAQLKAVQDRVAAMVDATGVPNGVLFVHGSLNDYGRNLLFKLLDTRKPGRFQVGQALNWISRDMAKAEAWLAETAAKFDIK